VLPLAAPIVCPGLFYAVPARDGTLSRIRVPGGLLTSQQAQTIAGLATEFSTTEFGAGEVQVTNRANLQIRAVQTPLPTRALDRLQELGLAGSIAAVDHLRNIMASPTAGIDPSALIDTRPIVQALDQYISSQPDLAGLPPKFSIGVVGGEAVAIGDRPNDIGFFATQFATRLKSGVHFRLKLNTGQGAEWVDLGIVLPPEQVVPIVAALAHIYLQYEHQVRDQATTKKPRLRQLVQHWGGAWFVQQLEDRLGLRLERSMGPADLLPSLPHTHLPHTHLGIHPQPQGLSYLGVVVPLGRLTAAQLRGLADLADCYGSGTLRLTPWQNLLIPDLPDAQIDRLQADLANLGLTAAASHPASAIVACAGSSGCVASATDTQRDAAWLIQELAQQVTLDRPLNIHLSGCPKSCAQHSPSDLALLGQAESGQYQVYAGSGDGSHPFGHELARSLPLKEIPALIEPLLRQYHHQRSPTESLGEFVDRLVATGHFPPGLEFPPAD
jgi:ferredoxin-nitrite reductase